jgi:probable HAF family extracellular repeat protein
MKSRMWTCTTVMISLVALMVAVRLAAQDSEAHSQQAAYSVVSLATLGGTSGIANTINNRNWAMGAANLAGNQTVNATVWLEGLTFDLGTLGGPNSGIEWPVKNNRGVIAGIAETGTANPLGEAWSCSAFFPTVTGDICLGFKWQNGVMTALPTLGGYDGYAAGVNDRGEIVGWAENTVHDSTCVAPQVLQFEAVIWGSNNQVQELPPFSGDVDGAATAINDQGQVVGISGVCDVAVGAFSAAHALLWQNGVPTNLGSLGGVAWNTPAAINALGEVVGFSDLPGDQNGAPNFHAFLWTAQTGMQDLGTLQGDVYSEALDINEQGQVVGTSCTANFASCRAFIWQNGVMTDLNTIIPPNSPLYLLDANGINNRGEIAGQAYEQSTGDTPPFRAIPTPGAGEARLPQAQRGAQTPRAAMPENVRQMILRRLGLDRSPAAPTRPQ